MPPRQYDLFEAEQRKQDGMAVTAANNRDWMDEVMEAARKHLPTDEDVMGEDVRRILSPLIGEPKSPGHTWGAAVSQLVRLHVLKPTGRWEKSRAVNNHGHKYQVYRR